MTYVVDLHTHSPYARGTSKRLTFENLASWAKIKGIDLLASADFTHPRWLRQTREALRENGDGLLEKDGVLFILGAEVSCVAELDGRSRRVHVLIFAPDFAAVERVVAAFGPLGSLASDGRPTLRISPNRLIHLLLEVDPRCFAIPAHLWTPWFGLYGSKSGFDSIEEAFGDVAEHVAAIETGLSSDPAMNWRVPSLDGVSIVSFSDAHSLQNLGRELTVMNGEPSYDGLAAALRSQDVAYTTEFFPEEGKYHHSGHRKCGVRLTPSEVAERGDRCPRCGRRLTLGVLQRAEELAERGVKTWMDDDGLIRGDTGRPPFRNLVSLRQIIAESLGVGVNARRVQDAYAGLVPELGSELAVLTSSPLADIASAADDRTAEGVGRVRTSDIRIDPGYDGQYGKVSVWDSPHEALHPSFL